MDKKEYPDDPKRDLPLSVIAASPFLSKLNKGGNRAQLELNARYARHLPDSSAIEGSSPDEAGTGGDQSKDTSDIDLIAMDMYSDMQRAAALALKKALRGPRPVRSSFKTCAAPAGLYDDALTPRGRKRVQTCSPDFNNTAGPTSPMAAAGLSLGPQGDEHLALNLTDGSPLAYGAASHKFGMQATDPLLLAGVTPPAPGLH